MSGPETPAAKVEIYTKWGCPYCSRALALLGLGWTIPASPFTSHSRASKW